jgi:hypothetical protein
MKLSVVGWVAGLAILMLLATVGRERLTRHQLRGHYYRMGEPPPNAINEFELTEEQLLLTLPLVGQRAFPYELDGDALLLGEQQELRFTNEGYGILRRDGTDGLAGRFIKLRQ